MLKKKSMKVKHTLSRHPSRIPPGVYKSLVFFILSLFFYTQDAFCCSTFMLKKGGKLVVGHNLDSGRHKPGLVIINKRGVEKQGKSWSELAYGKAVPNPPLKWISKYGSVTFAKYRDFPDGGVNEAGLFIVEMPPSSSSWKARWWFTREDPPGSCPGKLNI